MIIGSVYFGYVYYQLVFMLVGATNLSKKYSLAAVRITTSSSRLSPESHVRGGDDEAEEEGGGGEGGEEARA